MPKFIDLTGQKFGKLIVIKRTTNSSQNKTRWICKCECGNECIAIGNDMKTGHHLSCGCEAIKLRKIMHLKHGKSNSVDNKGKASVEYTTWVHIKGRCFNKKDSHYKHYGGRGITMEKSWLDSFECFYEDMGPRPSPEHSIERKNVDGNYCKENCVWADKYEQARNKRLSPKNKTGIKGVHVKGNRYVASLSYKGKNIHVGGFKTIQEAAQARSDLELKYWGKSS